MTMNRREQVLLLVVGASVLFGVSSLLVGPRIELWNELRRQQLVLREGLEADRELVAEADRWQAELAELSGLLPVYRPSSHWLASMDNIANTHGLRILQRRSADEEHSGELYELPIEVSEWEGTLESLVRFLYDLQSDGLLMDVRQLSIRPARGSMLRGRFILYAAYSRDESRP